MMHLPLAAALLVARPDTRIEDRTAILEAVGETNRSYALHGVENEQPWSEIGPPHLEVQSIRFLSSTSAEVAVVETRIGGIEIKRTSRVVVMAIKREGRWRISGA